MNEPAIEPQDSLPDSAMDTDTSDAHPAPKVTFRKITFSDETTIELEPADVVVIVGPNNSGKSVALSELEAYVGGSPNSIVLSSAEVMADGSAESFERFIRDNAQVKPLGGQAGWRIEGYGVEFQTNSPDLKSVLDQFWPGRIQQFRSFFCQRIPTGTRIDASNGPNSIDPLKERPSHPIHLLYDDEIEQKVSEYFHRAFGQDLILYRAGGRTSHLLVGREPAREQGEDRVSKTYLERLVASTDALDKQGDGMRSYASVILHLLAPVTPSILLLDEPEAFLHPPQARLLGELIASERSDRAQLFVATHSPDVLHGMISRASDNLRVLRIQRTGDVNHVKELDKEMVKRISVNPLLRYSSVMSGVFHRNVVICEGDPDCLFYSSLLATPVVYGDRYPDVLFLHGNGKHQIANLAKALVSLDVPVGVIADMDVLNDLEVLKGIVDSLGGNWASIESSARALWQAIDGEKPGVTIEDVKESVREVLDSESDLKDLFAKLKRNIDDQVSKVSRWEAIKSSGERALPSGEAVRHFNRIRTFCQEVGLWIVPVGELERFCTPVGGRGSRWAQQVLEQFDLKVAPELEEARKFVREMWERTTTGDT